MSDFSLAGYGGTRLTRRGLGNAARAARDPLLFGLLPALMVAVMVGASIGQHFAFDFHQFWQGGRDVLNGRSPYPPAGSLPHGGDPTLGPVEIQQVFKFPYPAPAALALVPLGALPFGVAAAFFVIGSIAAVFLALRLLEVADWRCYGIVFGSITTLGALRLGTFTPLLLLGLAASWRFRDRPWVAGPIVAALIVVKLFLWPVLIWLVLSRRLRTAAIASVLALAVTLASWAALGFAGLSDYPALLSTLADSVQGKSWSVVAFGLSLGLSATFAKALAVALGVAALGVALFAPGEKHDPWAFALAVAAAILLSPIVWLHYFLLLAAPLAIAFPVLCPAWLITLALWAWPFQETGGDAWKIALGLLVGAAMTAAALRSTPRLRPT
jgi:alpha-1,2-mannosyltransferase